MVSWLVVLRSFHFEDPFFKEDIGFIYQFRLGFNVRFNARTVILLFSIKVSLRLFGNHNRHFRRTNHWVIYKRFWLKSLFRRNLINTYSDPTVIWLQSFINRHFRNPHCPFHIEVHFLLDFFPGRLIQTWLILAIQEMGAFYFLENRLRYPLLWSSWWLFEIINLIVIIADHNTHSLWSILNFLRIFLHHKRVNYWPIWLMILWD